MLNKLISAFKQNPDSKGFNDIVKACQSDLRGYCRRLTAGDYALADDVAQESLITAYQQLGKLENIDAFKGWLYRIAYRNFLKQISKVKELGEDHIVELQTVQADDNEEFIIQLMAFLNEQQRAVLSLHITLGYNHEEISNILNMPIGTVKSHCKRGKDKLIGIGQKLQLGAA
ncbi:RNA polymerase sigma factor [Thalassotalea crassostreae]|uniref:RNA polymerase sigma factor n=1 Tax=Thalassotalea crassostreae TaxID=1763536 RepID=UPI000838AF59|nr:RNA polymerase sigma factor [Thalassotalea crassostreae]